MSRTRPRWNKACVGESAIVIVTGPPASGKSSLARGLAGELEMPFLSKDEFKERLYEVFGSGEAIERQIERAADSILFSVAQSNLNAGVDILLESNFDTRSDRKPLLELEGRIVQVHCGGDTDTLVEQFAERSASGKRHPGHEDHPSDADEVRRKLEAGHWDPLDLPGELIRLDLTSNDADVAQIAERVGRMTERSSTAV
jgi:predicted kinase